MQHHEDDEDFQVLPTQRMPLDEPNHFDNTPGDGDLLPSDPDSESDDSEGGSNNGADMSAHQHSSESSCNFGVDGLTQTSWPNRKEAVTALQQHSTLQLHKQVMVDNAMSGGKRVVLRCATALKSTSHESDLCGYKAVLTKRADTKFHLKPDSILAHENCGGVAKPNTRELSSLASTQSKLAANRAIPAKELHAAWQQQGLQVAAWKAYRARDVAAHEDLKHYQADYELIAPYLEDLRELNPGTHTALKADAEGQFEALFYSLGVVGDVANNCLMRCVQLDGAHMKHKEYNGVAFVLEGSDANGKNMMLTLGLVPKENELWYHWFLSHVRKSAIGKFLTEYQAAEWQGFSAFRPYAASIISDRHKGLPGPLQELFSEVYSVACTRHITTNMYAAKMGFNQAQAGLVWAAQKAESAAAYLSIMGQLNTLNPKAYEYLQRLGPENWALYSTSAQRVPMYSQNTSNRVEAIPSPNNPY
mgnify:CR=1 FL=1